MKHCMASFTILHEYKQKNWHHYNTVDTSYSITVCMDTHNCWNETSQAAYTFIPVTLAGIRVISLCQCVLTYSVTGDACVRTWHQWCQCLQQLLHIIVCLRPAVQENLKPVLYSCMEAHYTQLLLLYKPVVTVVHYITRRTIWWCI